MTFQAKDAGYGWSGASSGSVRKNFNVTYCTMYTLGF